MANMNNGTPVEKQASLSSDRLLQILECIARNRTPMRLQDLAEQTGLTQSTVLRYLRTLQNSNYVYQEENTLRYALTWKICKLTENLNTYLSLRNIANPFVNQLANELHAGVCLVVNQEDACLYLDCIDSPASSQAPLQFIGKRAPLHVTSSGKLMLSSFSEARVDDYISRTGLTRFTEYTITTRDDLIKELEQIRRQGYSLDMEECEIGMRCISYPIYCYNGSLFAAISVFGRTTDIDERFVQEQVHPLLKETSAIISQRLGYEN